MKSVWKWLLAAIALVGIAVAGVVISVERYHRTGPPAQERRAREATIKPLLETHATRNEVVKALGLEFVDYSVGSTNRRELERGISSQKVRQSADRYPGVLFHTTTWTMTWLFFDAEGKLQDYYLCEQ
ncbi:MAG TPA: hypothetical protein VK615_14855 [Candidatus Binatia bacterium]|nr:hypothetical protein [Candidatus Binatia bacterium]